MLRTMNFHLRDTFRARGEEVEAEAAAAEASRANSESQEEEEEVVVDVGEEEMHVMRPLYPLRQVLRYRAVGLSL